MYIEPSHSRHNNANSNPSSNLRIESNRLLLLFDVLFDVRVAALVVTVVVVQHVIEYERCVRTALLE